MTTWYDLLINPIINNKFMIMMTWRISAVPSRMKHNNMPLLTKVQPKAICIGRPIYKPAAVSDSRNYYC